ncbi:MAG: hypothetical protein M3Y04_10375, partial [Actinomycetota bacterium]|nr:hypothetical protein [Actinomycetota bacterium]
MARRGGTLDRPDTREVDPQGDDVEDWTTVWTCACGYGNVGRQRCIRCGKRAPTEAREAGGLW